MPEGGREGDLAAWAAERTMRGRHIDTSRLGFVHAGLYRRRCRCRRCRCRRRPHRRGADHQPFRATTGALAAPARLDVLGRSASRALASLAGAVRAAEAAQSPSTRQRAGDSFQLQRQRQKHESTSLTLGYQHTSVGTRCALGTQEQQSKGVESSGTVTKERG